MFLDLLFIANVHGVSSCIKALIHVLQVGYVIGSLLVETLAGWRYMYGASTPLAMIMGIGMWWLPESPRWLLLCAIQHKGDRENLKETAICCLCQLRGAAIGDAAPDEVEEILHELAGVGEENKVAFGEVFRGKCLKALTIGCGLVLFQQVFSVLQKNVPFTCELRTLSFMFFVQITGQPSVLYYAASILQVSFLGLCL